MANFTRPPWLPERIAARIELDGECWMWTGPARSSPKYPDRKYGNVSVAGQMLSTHRAVFEFSGREIPERLQLDHLCRRPLCCNPDHLEPVTPQENHRRSSAMGGALWNGVVYGNAAKKAAMTACKRGHQYTDDQPRDRRGHRVCRECKNIMQRIRRSEGRL